MFLKFVDKAIKLFFFKNRAGKILNSFESYTGISGSAKFNDLQQKRIK